MMIPLQTVQSIGQPLIWFTINNTQRIHILPNGLSIKKEQVKNGFQVLLAYTTQQ